MVVPRTVLFYAVPPVVLGLLYAVYRIWFAAGPEPENPAPPPAGETAPASDALAPFGGGAPAGALPGAAGAGAGGGTQPAPGAGEAVPAAGAAGATSGAAGNAPESVAAVLGELAAGLGAALPEATRWAQTPDLLRRAVAAVDCLAHGENPRRHLAFLVPDQPFQVAETGAGTVIAPASYARYDRLVKAFCQGDARSLASGFQRLEPALDLAYRQLGYGHGRFREVLAAAAAEMLATPVPAEPVRVVPSGRTYAFADPALQSQSDARKLLLRLGPENQRKVQARIRELAAAAGIELAPAP